MKWLFVICIIGLGLVGGPVIFQGVESIEFTENTLPEGWLTDEEMSQIEGVANFTSSEYACISMGGTPVEGGCYVLEGSATAILLSAHNSTQDRIQDAKDFAEIDAHYNATSYDLCMEHGGVSYSHQDSDDGPINLCTFYDGEVVEVWDFYFDWL